MHHLDYQQLIEKEGLWEDHWYIIGIDLGTTHSVVAYWQAKQQIPMPIDLSRGFAQIPMASVVQYRPDGGQYRQGEWVIGEEALKSRAFYPESTICSVKSHMGSDKTYVIADRIYTPDQISSQLLKQLIDGVYAVDPKAEIIGVMVSVPYGFDDSAKKATIKACELAGIKDAFIGLLEEPKGVTLAYSFHHALHHKEKLLVFDFGGGTLDMTLFEVIETGAKEMTLKVISEGGAMDHGGDQVDQILLDCIKTWIQSETGQSYDALSLHDQSGLVVLAKSIKERLSGVKTTRVPISCVIPPFSKSISQNELEKLLEGFIQKTKMLIVETLNSAQEGPIDPKDVDQILMAGGSSFMPWVKKLLLDIFSDEKKIYFSGKPALDIAIGATYYGAMKMGVIQHKDLLTYGKTIRFEPTVPHDIGFKVTYGQKAVFHPVIKRGTPYALSKRSQIFTVISKTGKSQEPLEIIVLERVNLSDSLVACKCIGRIDVVGIPLDLQQPVHVRVTLFVEAMTGLIHGEVVGIEAGQETFKKAFIPKRYETILLDVNEKE